MNTPKLWGGFTTCLLGGAIIWGIVTRSWFMGILGVMGVSIGSYFFLTMLNSLERGEIQRRQKKGDRREHR